MDIEEYALRQGRYVILGSVDGILAVLGIVIGITLSGGEARFILAGGFSAAVALALTNGTGSYLAESTVEYGKLAKMEEAMLTSLEDTHKETQTVRKIILDAISHGGFSFMGSLVPLLPFVGASFGQPVWEAFAYSMVALFALGVFSGRVSKKSMAVSVVKMIGMGLLVAAITFALGGGHA